MTYKKNDDSPQTYVGEPHENLIIHGMGPGQSVNMNTGDVVHFIGLLAAPMNSDCRAAQDDDCSHERADHFVIGISAEDIAEIVDSADGINLDWRQYLPGG